MREGDRLLDRWRLTTEVVSRDAIERWRGVDESTGEAVEVLILRPSRSDEASRRAFRRVHRTLLTHREPGVVQTLHVHAEGDAPFVVRRPTADATLDQVRGPLSADQVAAIGAALIPAVLAAGSATRGALLGSDVALDGEGRPIVAPRGAPLTQVVRGATRAAAPEGFDGAPPDGPAGLYGLGVLLFRLATGNRTADTAVRPSSIRHGIPAELDDAIGRLTSPDPASRAAALPLLQELAAPLEDLRPAVRPAAVTGTVAVGPGSESIHRTAPVSPGHDDPVALVSISAADLAALSPAALSTAAGVTGVPLGVVTALVQAQLPLVLAPRPGEGLSRAAATQRAQSLVEATGLPITVGMRQGLPPWVPGATTLALASLPALLVLITLVTGLWFVAAPLLAVLVGILVVGGWGVQRTRQRRAAHRSGIEGLRRQRLEISARSPDGDLDPAWGRLAELRRQLSTADLPPAADADLRGVLKDLEGRLEALARRSRSARDTLMAVDATALKTRLAALSGRTDPTDAEVEERERLARTVADLDEVARRGRSVAEESQQIRDTLSEIAAALGQLGDDPSEALLGRVEQSARAAEAALRGRQAQQAVRQRDPG